MLSADVKRRPPRALPNVLGIVEGVGSSESPAQAVAVTTAQRRARRHRSRSRPRPRPSSSTTTCDRSRPGSGAVGRLATRGRVPLGYYKDPERSARTFVEIDGARWSLPGDMATIDADGTVHLLGRGSQCINTGGEKVYPEEVEAVLSRRPASPTPSWSASPDERFGERVVAIVAAATDARHRARRAARRTAARSSRATSCRARSTSSTVIARNEAGKVDYAWARAVVDG